MTLYILSLSNSDSITWTFYVDNPILSVDRGSVPGSPVTPHTDSSPAHPRGAVVGQPYFGRTLVSWSETKRLPGVPPHGGRTVLG